MNELIVPVSKIDPYYDTLVLQFAHTPVFFFTFKCLHSLWEISVAWDNVEFADFYFSASLRTGAEICEDASGFFACLCVVAKLLRDFDL